MYVYCNQVFKLSSHLLMMYRGFGVAIIMFPMFFLIGGHFSWLFYLLTAIQGLSIGFIDNRYFRSAKVFGAEITGALQPLSLVLTFVFWFLLKPSLLLEHLSHPLHFCLIIISLGGIITAVMLLRRAKLNKKAASYLFPCILLGGFNDTNSKIIMDMG
ncbi:MAG: hypothetical protein LBL47_02295, partial [Lactobacillus sp.]|nr:hypothetical protein [Lactobacillus sp.]